MQDEMTVLLPEETAEETQETQVTDAVAEDVPASEAADLPQAVSEADLLRAHLAEVEAELAAERQARLRREVEDAGRRALASRSLDATLLPLLLGEGDGVSEAQLSARADALAEAIEDAACRMLRRRAGTPTPVRGDMANLSGAMIRDMPLSQLAEIMQYGTQDVPR